MTEEKLLTYLETYLTPQRKARFDQVIAQRTNFLTVAIEDVYQLHNTSAVVRSCDAFGIQKVHVVEERYEKRLDENIAMGAQKWVDIHRYPTTNNCIKSLREQGYSIVATSPHKKAVTANSFAFNQKTALFFGTEWNGLTDTVLAQADSFLHIPMLGFTESLNVSVSVAVLLQQLTQKLRASNLPWQLNKEQLLATRLQWTKNSIKNVEGIISHFKNQNA